MEWVKLPSGQFVNLAQFVAIDFDMGQATLATSREYDDPSAPTGTRSGADNFGFACQIDIDMLYEHMHTIAVNLETDENAQEAARQIKEGHKLRARFLASQAQ